MKYNRRLRSIQLSLLAYLCASPIPINSATLPTTQQETMTHKTVLPNGLTILVRPDHRLPKVNISVCVNAGSRDETDDERGIAHLIEHMIFKGTNNLLSESDIKVAFARLAGIYNAFTSHDSTVFFCTLPSCQWTEGLPMMADCMVNCAFKDDPLNSEMKTVIQELKGYRDSAQRMTSEQLLREVYSDCTYMHPIIGYKKDLWSVHGQDLLKFYKKHYVPNNITVVIVGDVAADEAVAQVTNYFGAIPADESYQRTPCVHNRNNTVVNATIHRDVSQPMAWFAFEVPGLKDNKEYALDALALVLGGDRSSRLYKRVVEELKLAHNIHVHYSGFAEEGLFAISCTPTSADNIERIREEIINVIGNLLEEEISDQEMDKVIEATRMGLFRLLESIEEQAMVIGKYFMVLGDENYLEHFNQKTAPELRKEMMELVATYLTSDKMHQINLLPANDEQKAGWRATQEAEDAEDVRFLAARVRTTPVEEARYALTVGKQERPAFDFPKATQHQLENGLKILYGKNSTTPTVFAYLTLKMRESVFDPEDKPGLTFFASSLLTEDTKQFTTEQLSHELATRGISISMHAGVMMINAPTQQFEFALDMARQMLTEALFDDARIETVRARLISSLRTAWDNAGVRAGEFLMNAIYKEHPYTKSMQKTLATLESITKQDLLDFYHQYVSPYGAVMSVVGNIDEQDAVELINKYLGAWSGPEIADAVFPPVAPTTPERIDVYLDRDQVSLNFGLLSVPRMHPDFDKLRLFDHILAGSMSSRLFKLREESGLFYGIGGSTVSGAMEYPGIMHIGTLVSVDRVEEAEKAIVQTLAGIVDTLTEQELADAKKAQETGIIERFASSASMAVAFVALDRFNLPADFYDTRMAEFNKITLQEVQETVRKLLVPEQFVVVRVGRIMPAPATQAATEQRVIADEQMHMMGEPQSAVVAQESGFKAFMKNAWSTITAPFRRSHQ